MNLLPFFIGNPIRAIVTSVAAVALVPTAALAAYKTVQVIFLKKDNAVLRINLDEVRNFRAAEKKGYELAQAQAKFQAEEAKKKIEAKYKSELERKNRELAQTRSTVRAAANRYADANSVRGPCPRTAADSVRSGGTDLPESPSTTVVVNGEYCDSSLVAISRVDFDALVDNTIKLVNAREWALRVFPDE